MAGRAMDPPFWGLKSEHSTLCADARRGGRNPPIQPADSGAAISTHTAPLKRKSRSCRDSPFRLPPRHPSTSFARELGRHSYRFDAWPGESCAPLRHLSIRIWRSTCPGENFGTYGRRAPSAPSTGINDFDESTTVTAGLDGLPRRRRSLLLAASASRTSSHAARCDRPRRLTPFDAQ